MICCISGYFYLFLGNSWTKCTVALCEPREAQLVQLADFSKSKLLQEVVCVFYVLLRPCLLTMVLLARASQYCWLLIRVCIPRMAGRQQKDSMRMERTQGMNGGSEEERKEKEKQESHTQSNTKEKIYLNMSCQSHSLDHHANIDRTKAESQASQAWVQIV